MNQLKSFNLAESALDGTLNNTASTSAQPRIAIETCTPCVPGAWGDSFDQRFDKICTHSRSNPLDFLGAFHALVSLLIQVNCPPQSLAVIVAVLL